MLYTLDNIFLDVNSSLGKLTFLRTYNPGQTIWNIVKKSTKIPQK